MSGALFWAHTGTAAQGFSARTVSPFLGQAFRYGFGFIGLVVPHAVRSVVGPSNRAVLVLSLLFGGAFLAGMDLLARVLASPAELPIGVLTAFIGAPFFLWILRTRGTVG